MSIQQTRLHGRIYAALMGGALGDSLAAPVEGWTYEQIQEKHGWIRADAPVPDWTGRITDDTYVKNSLCQAYIDTGRHLTAIDVVPMWSSLDPERLWLPEKYTHMLARHTQTDPFFAGHGNMVICGAAMHIAPVGLVNPADPAGAYREAVSVAAINTHSFGLEGAAVLAAGIAAAMSPDADRDTVLEAVLTIAHDGTKKALKEIYDLIKGSNLHSDMIIPIRDITTRYDGRLSVGNPGSANREKCLEEVAAAFAMFYLADGSVAKALEGALNFGQDTDSIAAMAGALSGAMSGAIDLPATLAAKVDKVSGYDTRAIATFLAETVLTMSERQAHILEKTNYLRAET